MNQPAKAEIEALERDPISVVDALARRGRVAMDAFADSDGNGGAKLVHGSGGIVSLRAEQNSAT